MPGPNPQPLSNDTVSYATQPALRETYRMIADRIGVAPNELVALNFAHITSHQRDERESTAPMDSRIATGTIRLPLPLQARDFLWDRHTLTDGETLTSICAAANAHVLHAVPPVTAEMLWNHPLNASLRAATLVRQANHAPTAAEAAALGLPRGREIWVPYRRLERVAPAQAPPNAPVAAQRMPLPLDELIYEHLRPIERTTRLLRELTRQVERVARASHEAHEPLTAMRTLLDFFREAAPTHNLDIVSDALNRLVERAGRCLNDETVRALCPGEQRQYTALAQQLVTRLRSPRFDELSRMALEGPELDVVDRAPDGGGQRTTIASMLSRITVDACVALVFVPEVEAEARQLLQSAVSCFLGEVGDDNALSRIARHGHGEALRRNAPVRAATVETGWIPLAAHCANLVNVSVGNLPGPPSATVAFVNLFLLNRARNLRDVPQSLVPSFVRWAFASAGMEAEAAGFLRELRVHVARRDRTWIERQCHGLESRFQAGRGWGALGLALGLVSLTAALLEIESGTSVEVADQMIVACGLLGAINQSVSGALLLFNPPWAARALPALGRMSGVIGLLASSGRFVMTWYREGLRAVPAQTWASVGASAALLIPCPLIQAAAVALSIGLAGVDLVSDFRGTQMPLSQRACVGLVRAFRAHEVVAAMLARGLGGLRAPIDELEQLIVSRPVLSSPASFPTLFREARHVQRLTALGFNSASINEILFVVPTEDPGLGRRMGHHQY